MAPLKAYILKAYYHDLRCLECGELTPNTTTVIVYEEPISDGEITVYGAIISECQNGCFTIHPMLNRREAEKIKREVLRNQGQTDRGIHCKIKYYIAKINPKIAKLTLLKAKTIKLEEELEREGIEVE